MHRYSVTSISALACAVTLVFVAAAPRALAQDTNPNAMLVTLTGPGVYPPGEAVELTLHMDTALTEDEGPAQFGALGVDVRIPAGWAYAQFGGSSAGVVPDVQPQRGREDDLGFAWISSDDAEQLPHRFHFSVNAPEDADGPADFEAQVIYFTPGGNSSLSSDPFVLSIPRATAPPPEITLLGGEIVVIETGDDFVDPGWTAVDAAGTDISDRVEVTLIDSPNPGQSNVDPSVLGDYVLEYNVTDDDGNPAAPRTRLVQVVPRDTTAKGFFLCGPGRDNVAGSRWADALIVLLTAGGLWVYARGRTPKARAIVLKSRQAPRRARKDNDTGNLSQWH